MGRDEVQVPAPIEDGHGGWRRAPVRCRRQVCLRRTGSGSLPAAGLLEEDGLRLVAGGGLRFVAGAAGGRIAASSGPLAAAAGRVDRIRYSRAPSGKS